MSDTPRTDAAVIATDMPRGAPVAYVTADFAGRLEKENAAMFRALKECVDALDLCRKQHDGQGSYAYHHSLAIIKKADLNWGVRPKPKPWNWM
jgi:hypothetical protein